MNGAVQCSTLTPIHEHCCSDHLHCFSHDQQSSSSCDDISPTFKKRQSPFKSARLISENGSSDDFDRGSDTSCKRLKSSRATPSDFILSLSLSSPLNKSLLNDSFSRDNSGFSAKTAEKVSLDLVGIEAELSRLSTRLDESLPYSATVGHLKNSYAYQRIRPLIIDMKRIILRYCYNLSSLSQSSLITPVKVVVASFDGENEQSGEETEWPVWRAFLSLLRSALSHANSIPTFDCAKDNTLKLEIISKLALFYSQLISMISNCVGDLKMDIKALETLQEQRSIMDEMVNLYPKLFAHVYEEYEKLLARLR